VRKTATRLALVALLGLGALAAAQAAKADFTYAGYANVLASTPDTADQAGSVGFRSREQCITSGGAYETNRSESHLAVDPSNPSRMLGTSKFFYSATDPFADSASYGQFVDWSGEYQFHLGYYDILSGTPGANRLIPGYTCADLVPLNHKLVPGYDATTDPVAAFDTQGNAYAFVLGYNYDDFVNGMYVSKRDAGGSWGTPVQVDTFGGFQGGGHEFDKQWIAVDTTVGQPFSHTDYVYLTWVDFSAGAGGVGRIRFSRSTDHGATFSKPKTIGNLDNPHAFFPQVAVDGRGIVYVVWHGNLQGAYKGLGSLVVVASEDGGETWNGPFIAFDFNWPGLVGTFNGWTVHNTTFRDGISYYFDSDPRGSYVYAVDERWSAPIDQAGHYDVTLHRGLYDPATNTMSWVGLGQVNDETGTDAFQPAVVASAGLVAVAWYDRRLPCGTDPSYFTAPGATNYCINTGLQFYGSNGAVRRGSNIRASQYTWDPQQPYDWLDLGVGNLPHSQFNPCFTATIPFCVTFIGDYFGLALANGNAYVLNVSTAPAFNTLVGPIRAAARNWWSTTAWAVQQREECLVNPSSPCGITPYYQQQVLQIVPVP
jgi:hypothetical protein